MVVNKEFDLLNEGEVSFLFQLFNFYQLINGNIFMLSLELFKFTFWFLD